MNPLTRTSATAALLGLVALLGTACDDAAPPSLASPVVEERPLTLLESWDEGCDGVIEQYTRTTYDLQGQPVREEKRSQWNPERHYCQTVWLRDDGATVREEDADCDGVPNDCGATLESPLLVRYESDEGCDGILERWSQRERNEAGESLHSIEVEVSSTTGEVECVEWRSSFREDGTKLSSTMDEGCDGVVDRCSNLLLDAAGREVGWGWDQGCDGAYEGCTLSTLGGPDSILGAPEGAACLGATLECATREEQPDPRGTRIFLQQDEGCDGIPERCDMQLVDAEGDELERAFDGDCDGTPDYRCSTSTYTREAGLTTQLHTIDYDCDGAPEECSRTIYGRGGFERILDEADDGCDGELDYCYYVPIDDHGMPTSHQEHCAEPKLNCSRRRYDDAGRVVYEARDRDCDGKPQTCDVLAYDAQGRLISLERDNNCNGNFNYCESTTWHPLGPRLSFTKDQGCDGRPEVCIETIPVD